MFALANAPAWLYVARALQGIAVGLVSGPATAALVELDPDPEHGRPALLAGLAQAIGSGTGPLVAGLLAQVAPAPLHLSFLVGAVVTAAWLVLVRLIPEPGGFSSEPWRMQWPRVPAAIRAHFWRLGLTGGLVWASLALYLSVVPSYVAEPAAHRQPRPDRCELRPGLLRLRPHPDRGAEVSHAPTDEPRPSG